ncbi:MAG TPA: hypothetical protein VFJ57_12015 [Solirubrobacterales bacterium]|nr:hypothetical protein [Solirubrobacterales bacterium]
MLRLLAVAHDLLGRELAISLGSESRYFGLTFVAELERVSTPLDGEAVTFHFANGVALDLAPGEQIVIAVEDRLELLLDPDLVVELSPEPKD